MSTQISTVVNQLASKNSEATLFKYTEENINKAVSVVESKFSDLSKLNYQTVGTIGKQEYDQIQIKLSSLTSTIDKMKSPGIIQLLDDLEKDVTDAELDSLWMKACAVKPSMWSKIKSSFGSRKYLSASIQSQNDVLFNQLRNNTGDLNKKVNELKKELISKRSEQMVCVQVLTEGFSTYLEQLTELATQHLIVSTVRQKQEVYVDSFKSQVNLTPEEQKQLINAESVLSSLVNRELVIQKSIVQVPIIVQQYKIIMDSCNSTLQEIDNTLDGTINSIISNVNILAIAMKSQQALSSQETITRLENNVSTLSQKVVGEVAKKAATLSSDTRLKESEQLEKAVQNIIKLNEDLSIANEKQKQQYIEASERMSEVARIINQEFVK